MIDAFALTGLRIRSGRYPRRVPSPAPPSRIRVAVTTRRTPEGIAGCLRALAREQAGAGALLVISGLDGGAVAAHARALRTVLPDAEVLAEPRPGASRARNRALAACRDDEVVA